MGNIKRLGLPCLEFEWSLKGKKERKRKVNETEDSVWVCEHCFSVNPGKVRFCSNCEKEKSVKSITIKEVEGELKEIEKENIKRQKKIKKKEQAMAQTLEDLIKLGFSRGYEHPYSWASRVYNSRRK